jgi:hypothetical protein
MGKVTTLFYSPFDGVKPVYYRSVSNTGSLANRKTASQEPSENNAGQEGILSRCTLLAAGFPCVSVTPLWPEPNHLNEDNNSSRSLHF